MATNYGAWDAVTGGAGSGQQALAMLQGILGSRRASKEHQAEMERQARIDARGEANIPASSIFKGAPVGFNLTQAQASAGLENAASKRATDQMGRRYELKQQELSASEKSDIQAGLVADTQFKNVAAQYMAAPVGPVKAFIADKVFASPMVGNSAIAQNTMPEEAKYRRKLALAIQARGKFISGVAMSEPEALRIASTFPPLGSSPELFNDAMDNMYKEMNARLSSIPESRSVAGYPEVAEGMRSRLPKFDAPRVGGAIPSVKGSGAPPSGGASAPPTGSASERLARLRAQRQGK